MASLLLLVRAIVSGGTDEILLGARGAPEEVKQPEMCSPKRPVVYQGCRSGDDDEAEEERWLVICLRWPRIDRQSAWMQTI